MDKNLKHEICSILLAEDNKINQKLVLLILNKLGAMAVVAETGQEAVDYAKEREFDLILMDLHMPGMDGVEATQRIKSDLGSNCPHIVALTADAKRGADVEAMSQGLDGYLTKPINSEMLRNCINTHTSFSL